MVCVLSIPAMLIFFWELLPGTRTRDGVPASVQFWVRRLEEHDADATFSVGLIYGPSGCGKSSLMKAGVLPHLNSSVKTVYVEATPADTEQRILRGIRKRQVALPKDLDLVRSLQWLRQHGDGKTLIVIDQFEQWLHVNEVDPQCDLIRTLRQCDGAAVQAVVMIRDDFAMAAARFMDALDIPIVQGTNFATVDLFDESHAAAVLGRCGQAFGTLPQNAEDFTATQRAFLKSVAAGLANGGQVVPVQLALFAEMIKKKPWELSTLDAVGGTTGVGVNFLEETFSSRSANPTHKKHQIAARDVLKALLPEVGSDIKGHMRSHAELLQVSGYQNREVEFNDLLRVLDGGLRLITPTDTDGNHSDSGSGIWSKHYQLTHDYLVPSLRDWLTRKQQSTRQGRAELRLEERRSLWSTRRENRQLPSFGEWAAILWYVRRETWSGSATAMMRAATKMHVGRLLSVLCSVLIIVAAGFYGRHLLRRRADAVQTSNLVGDLWQAKPEHVPQILKELDKAPSGWREAVKVTAESNSVPPSERARAWLALSDDSSEFLPPLTERLLTCNSAEHGLILKRLASRTDQVAELMWERTQEKLSAEKTVQAAVVLAQTAPNSEHWAAFAARTADALVASDPLFVNVWVNGLSDVRRSLHDPLMRAASRVDLPNHRRLMAIGVIAHFSRSDAVFPDAESLLQLTLSIDETISDALDDMLSRRREDMLPLLMREATATLENDQSQDYDAVVQRKANAVLATQQLGEQSPFWDNLDEAEDPRVRTELINRADRWKMSTTNMITALANRPALARQAVILGLASELENLANDDRQQILETITGLYQTDPESGVHAAAELALRRHRGDQAVSELQTKLIGNRVGNWQILSNGLCLVSVDRPGSVSLGSSAPKSELGLRKGRRDVTIDYPFQISATEITVQQYQQFDPSVPYSEAVRCASPTTRFVSGESAGRAKSRPRHVSQGAEFHQHSADSRSHKTRRSHNLLLPVSPAGGTPGASRHGWSPGTEEKGEAVSRRIVAQRTTAAGTRSGGR